MWRSIAVTVLLILLAPSVKFFMQVSSDRTRLLVKDYVSSLSMPNRHTAPEVELRHLRYVLAVAGMENVSRAVEAGTGVAIATDFGYSFGNRLKFLHVTPEPKPISVGIVGPKGRLSPAAEKFWQCAKEAAQPATKSINR